MKTMTCLLFFTALLSSSFQAYGANSPSCPSGYQLEDKAIKQGTQTIINCRNGHFKLQRHYEEGLLVEQISKGEKINISYNNDNRIVAIKKRSGLSGKIATSCRYLGEKVRAVEGSKEYCQFLQLQWSREQNLIN
jgi:hypothetical protein